MEDMGEEEVRIKVSRAIGYSEATSRRGKSRALFQEFTVLAAPDSKVSERCLTWLAGLSPLERLRVVSFRDPWFASMLRQMFSIKVERGDLIFSFTEKEDWRPCTPLSYYFYGRVCNKPPAEECREAELILEQSIRMTDWGSYIDTVTIDPDLAADFPKFLNIMSRISKDKAFAAPCTLRQVEDSKMWFFDSPPWIFSSFNSLSVWAGVWLERGIWINFWKSVRPDPRLDVSDEPKTLLFEDLTALSQCWVKLRAEEQEALLSAAEMEAGQYAATSGDGLVELLGPATVILEGNGNSLRIGSLHKSVGCYYQKYYGLIQHNNEPEAVLDLRRKARSSPKTFVEFLLLSSLDRTMTLLDIVCRQLVIKLSALWSKQVALSLLSELEAVSSKPAIAKDPKKKKRPKQRIKDTVTTDIEDAEEICGTLLRSIVDSALQQVSKESPSWPFVAQPSSTNLLAKMKELNPPSPKAKKAKKKKTKRNKKASIGNVVGSPPVLKKPLQPTLRLHQEITAFCQDLATKFQALEPARTVLIGKLRSICCCLFPDSELIVYGSYPTGLALESSDIDTVILGVSKESHSRSLQCLGNALQTQVWVSKVTVIDTASVPIVKLEALADGQLTKLDVTFDDRKLGDTGTHKGVERLAYTQELLRELQPLRELTLVLKCLLTRHEMNSAYRGYLSSYSLLLWTAARFRASPWSDRDLGQLLIDFLSFYAFDFDPQRTGINLTQSP